MVVVVLQRFSTFFSSFFSFSIYFLRNRKSVCLNPNDIYTNLCLLFVRSIQCENECLPF